MIKDSVAVIDIGSSKITAMIGENGVNGNFIIRSVSEVKCEAFLNGEVTEEKELRAALSQALGSVCKTASATVTEVSVSVPAQFFKVVDREYDKSYPRRKRFRKKDVAAFYREAEEAAALSIEGHALRLKRAMFFNLDGNRRVEELLGEVSMNVRGYISYFFVDESFISAIGGALGALGVKTVNYIPTALAESHLLFSSEERFSFRILLDVGYITTDLSILYGGGLLYSTAVNMGGGYVTAFLCNDLNIDFDLAEKLKRRLNLSVPTDTEGSYEVSWGEELYTFSQRKANECARGVLDRLIEEIDKALVNSRVKFPRDAVINLTGGGISYIRGAKEYLFNGIEMPVTLVQPKLVYMSRPDETSKVALLDYALNKL